MATEQDFERIAEGAAERGAEKAIREAFKLLAGVDIADQNQVNLLRKDLEWARETRQLSQRLNARVLMILVTMVVSGLAIALWEGIKQFSHK